MRPKKKIKFLQDFYLENFTKRNVLPVTAYWISAALIFLELKKGRHLFVKSFLFPVLLLSFVQKSVITFLTPHVSFVFLQTRATQKLLGCLTRMWLFSLNLTNANVTSQQTANLEFIQQGKKRSQNIHTPNALELTLEIILFHTISQTWVWIIATFIGFLRLMTSCLEIAATGWNWLLRRTITPQVRTFFVV